VTTTPPVPPALGDNQEVAGQDEFLPARTGIPATAEHAISALIARDGAIADYLGPKIAQCEAAGPIPQLGTAEWEHLDDGDPRKVGAVFVAAREWTTITSLRRWKVLDEPRQAEVERLTCQRESSHAVCEAVDWTKQATRLSHAQLVRRRSVVVQ